MASRLNPYLSFDGNAREAMQFYNEALGGELRVSTFGEYGADDEALRDKVMHAMFETGAGFTLMGADTPPGMPYNRGDNVAVSLSGDDETELRGYWDKLSDGATITVPLEKQMWGDVFGMLTDRFGIGWMVNIAQAQES